MIEIRPFSKITDFDDLNEFTDGQGFPRFDPRILPTIGVCVYDDNKKLCFAWLYLESSTVFAIIEWTITNPENTPKESYKSLQVAVKHLTGIALKLGYIRIMTSSNNKGLIRIYEKAGFIQTDEKVTQLLYKE